MRFVSAEDGIQNSYELSEPLLTASLNDQLNEQCSTGGKLPVTGRSPLTPLPAEPWSSAPQSLLRRGWLEVAELVADVVVTCIPVLFLIFDGIASWLDSLPRDEWGEKVRRAANLGPSVFPIAFAVIVRRMLREGARWRAQRGAPLGALDELLGSASIFGAIEMQFLLRSCSVTGVLLLVLWALSPIGGQASLRLVTTRNLTRTEQPVVLYLAKEQASTSAFIGPAAWSKSGKYMRLLYESSLIAPDSVKYGPEDLWRNAKLHSLDDPDLEKTDVDGWVDIHSARWIFRNSPSRLRIHISRIAAPLVDRGEGQTAHFTVETQYFTLKCSNLQKLPCGNLTNGTVYQTNPASWGSVNHSATNATSRFGKASFILATNTPWYGRHESNHSLPAREIIWQSKAKEYCRQVHCLLALAHVEANITCTARINFSGWDYRVSHMRPSRRPHPSQNYTPLDNPNTLQNFFDKWPEVHSESLVEERSPIEKSLWWRDDLFSLWLTTLWNTAWQAGVAPTYYYDGLQPLHSHEATIAAGRLVELPSGSLHVNMTTATLTFAREKRYVCEKHWLVLLIVASSALLLSGVVGLWAKYTTIAPDILTHASSLTRNNPFIPLPPGGNTLDGMERARALKHVRVRLQDVQTGAPVGHDPPGRASAASTSRPAAPVGYLQKRRLYA